jgi:hypothetical protein
MVRHRHHFPRTCRGFSVRQLNLFRSWDNSFHRLIMEDPEPVTQMAQGVQIEQLAFFLTSTVGADNSSVQVTALIDDHAFQIQESRGLRCRGMTIGRAAASGLPHRDKHLRAHPAAAKKRS